MTTLTDDRTIPGVLVPTPWSTRRGVVVIGVLGTIVAIGIVVFATIGHSTDSQSLDLRRVAVTGTACQMWVATEPSATGTPSSNWCTGMTGWLADQVTTGQVAGPMMWNSPQSMADTCSQWAAAASAPCAQMSNWMSQHMGVWNSWRDWDAHMAGWGSSMMSR